MQVDSIISNTISEETRQKGHQSIRFSPDGFSILISDASYRPVVLQIFKYDADVPVELQSAEWSRMLEEARLFRFDGETVLIVDTPSTTLVPRQYFDEQQARELLQKACVLRDTDQVRHRLIRNRSVHLLYGVPQSVGELEKRFSGDVRIIHTAECLVSLSDQVQASDHQRGAVLIDVQSHSLDILVIQGDQIILLNRYLLQDPSEFIYHTLNTVKQLDLNRETIPIYLSGIIHEEHELFGLLGKYIRSIKTTPYYMEEISKVDILRHMILSEGSKCA
jgi:hypothetical protein